MKHRKVFPDDYSVIASIAKECPGFTVPEPYILWMLSETQGDFCRVATDESSAEVLGYILTLKSADGEELFVWQIAVAPGQPKQAYEIMRFLLDEVLELAKAHHISRVRFSCSERREERLTRLAEQVCNVKPMQGNQVPIKADIPENEFSVLLH